MVDRRPVSEPTAAITAPAADASGGERRAGRGPGSGDLHDGVNRTAIRIHARISRIVTVADVPTAVEQSCSFARAARERGARRNSDELSPDEVQVRLIRDIFGNPYLPVACDPAWRTSDVMLLARGIYEEKAFDRMPILADALQDAGCTSDELLNHLRDPLATHVRGCWALDLVRA